MNRYDIGDRIRLKVEFRAIDSDALADPTTVTCKVKAPLGGIEDAVTSHVSQGVFIAFIEPDEPGVWTYKFYGTGDVVAAGAKSFVVNRSEFE